MFHLSYQYCKDWGKKSCKRIKSAIINTAPEFVITCMKIEIQRERVFSTASTIANPITKLEPTTASES